MKSTVVQGYAVACVVAPVRERGLKYHALKDITLPESRSREGAWIEIEGGCIPGWDMECRSREGAWIEIFIGRR